jgi:hypothetical protein
MFSVGSVQSGYKEVFGSIEKNGTGVVEKREVEFRDASCQDMNLGAEELN